MKTRSNMPLYVLEVSNVKTLSNAQIDLLRCGDYLVKKDASGEHAYKVTFKSDTGLCLTYHDASVVETQSYDKIDGVWTYNSEDKTPNLLELQNVEDAPDGTINKALGLDSNGGLVKGTISGGTKLYKHSFSITGSATINGNSCTISGAGTTPQNIIEIISNEDGQSENYKYYLLHNFGLQNCSINIRGQVILHSKIVASIGSQSSGYPLTFSNRNGDSNFIKDNEMIVNITYSYPSASPKLAIYGQDEIDLTTGKVKARTNLCTASSLTITDTITEL